MIGYSEISVLSISDRFFEYAQAYLDASIVICQEMISDESKKTWPNASVALLLAVHSTELFIKGAIISRKPEEKLDFHRLMKLKDIYDDLLPEEELSWILPFRMEYIGFSEEEVATLKKSEPIPSIQFRYPVDKSCNEWKGAFGFTPDGFQGILINLDTEFKRIRDALSGT